MLPSGVLSLRIRGHSSELITAASHMYGLDFYQVASNSFVRTLAHTRHLHLILILWDGTERQLDQPPCSNSHSAVPMQ